jgi:hypothetical protein
MPHLVCLQYAFVGNIGSVKCGVESHAQRRAFTVTLLVKNSDLEQGFCSTLNKEKRSFNILPDL